MGLRADEVYAILKRQIQGGGSGGTTNYGDLNNKPQINGVELIGNKTPSDLNLVPSNYGTENANKLLGTGSDGNVVLVEKVIFTIEETTTFGEVYEAYNAGKLVFLKGIEKFQVIYANKNDFVAITLAAIIPDMEYGCYDNRYYLNIYGLYDQIIADASSEEGSELEFKVLTPKVCNTGSHNVKDVYDIFNFNVVYVLDSYKGEFYLVTSSKEQEGQYYLTLQRIQNEDIQYMTISGNDTTSLFDAIHSPVDGWHSATYSQEWIYHGTSDTTQVIYLGEHHKWGAVESLSIILGGNTGNTVNEYVFVFDSGEVATNLSLPSSVQTDIIVEPMFHYECSIIDGYMTFHEWPITAS